MVHAARPIGDLDLHLFGEGTHRRLWELLGPQPLRVDVDGQVHGVRLAVWAPRAAAVSVVADWNGWTPQALAPVSDASGIWGASIPAARSGNRYKFEIHTADGRTLQKADPMARESERPPSDASVIPKEAEHAWADAEWMRTRRSVIAGDAPMRTYEVHLGSWRAGVDRWDDLAAALSEHVSNLGFTHVELLPIAEHPFAGSWGYQVSGYYAPTARFGEPEGFRRFVDTMHQRGIGVILDWVPAHFPRDAWSLGRFDGDALYEHPDPQLGEHPEWGTYVFDYGRNEVRNFLVANALYWLDEFHVDGLRVDAVASMIHLDYSRAEGQWTPNEYGGREHLDAVAFVRELNTVVAEEFPEVLMIAEESTAWPGVTRAVGSGGLGFSHKWNLGWMHDTLGYLSLDPVDRRHHHNDMTFAQLYAYDERFVLPLSHDEVVHGKGSLLSKVAGDESQRFATLRTLLAWQWSLPGSPLVFMGTELASEQEWDATSGLAWHLLEQPAHRGVHDLLRQLNVATDSWPALWRRDGEPGGFQWLDADDGDHSMFSFLRWDCNGENAVVAVANFTPVARSGYRVGAPWGGEWEVVVDTDAETWGGSGRRGDATRVLSSGDPWQRCGSSIVVDVGPSSMLYLAAHAPR